MVPRAEDYMWSSANANAFGKSDPTINPHSVFLDLGGDRDSRLKSYQALLNEPVNEHEI